MRHSKMGTQGLDLAERAIHLTKTEITCRSRKHDHTTGCRIWPSAISRLCLRNGYALQFNSILRQKRVLSERSNVTTKLSIIYNSSGDHRRIIHNRTTRRYLPVDIIHARAFCVSRPRTTYPGSHLEYRWAINNMIRSSSQARFQALHNRPGPPPRRSCSMFVVFTSLSQTRSTTVILLEGTES